MNDKILWAPWRYKFIKSKKEKGCVFCNRIKMKDTVKNLIVYRGEKVCVIMNKFPYNTGHVMVLPIRHIGQIERLTTEESIEFFETTRLAVKVIKKALGPDSLNLGMNLGRSSGAGIPGHVHMHIVPRWQGDTNFMPVVGKTEIISVPLEPIYRKLVKEFSRR